MERDTGCGEGKLSHEPSPSTQSGLYKDQWMRILDFIMGLLEIRLGFMATVSNIAAVVGLGTAPLGILLLLAVHFAWALRFYILYTCL